MNIQLKNRLFKKSRPEIRPLNPSSDLWVLWAAYDLESFPNLPKGMTKEQFNAYVLHVCKAHSSCLVVEDDCRYFKSGRGPVCFISIVNDGWKVVPHADFFRWATPRMILRVHVAFFQMIRYSKEVGVCVVNSLANTVPLFNRLKRYGLLFSVGRIPDGDARGDVFLFSVKGKKEVKPQAEIEEKVAA